MTEKEPCPTCGTELTFYHPSEPEKRVCYCTLRSEIVADDRNALLSAIEEHAEVFHVARIKAFMELFPRIPSQRDDFDAKSVTQHVFNTTDSVPKLP